MLMFSLRRGEYYIIEDILLLSLEIFRISSEY